MRKLELINKVSKATGIDRQDVDEIVEATIHTIKKVLIKGDSVFIRGFGSFVNKKRAKKTARNISTNTALILEAHYVPSFKPSKKFVKSVKENNKVND